MLTNVLKNLIKFHVATVFCIAFGPQVTWANDLNFSRGNFISSWETGITGPHNIQGRQYSFALVPNLSSYKSGWNYNRRNGKKDGLQIYIDGTYVSVEFYQNGQKRTTATYRDGKPSGWFYRFNSRGDKEGLQHYVDGDYLSVEMFQNGEKVTVGAYRGAKPSGWFYSYSNRKKHGTQIYVDGTYWTVENYAVGVKHGSFSSYRKNKRDGWQYEYRNGKKTSEVYYSNGVAR